jgi:enoyl-CoA hydratase
VTTEPSVTTAPPVLSEVIGAVGVVTLNRPGARNALSSAVLAALPAALMALDDDPEVQAIILTGADPAFCAGLDLRELGNTGANLGARRADPGDRPWPAWSPWPELHTPLIGAVNGPAVTGGLELALNCDFLVASERARFADTHTRVGVLPGWGLTVLLPDAVGLRAARDMSATGRFVGADEALRLGLVNRVVAHGELMATALAVGEEIASNEADAVSKLYASYRASALMTREDGLRHEQEVGRRWSQSNFDQAEVARRRDAIIERGSRRI